MTNNMNLPLIVEELEKIFGSDVNKHYTSDDYWRFYVSLSGIFDEDYFDLYFRENCRGEKTVEIAETTENTKKYFEMIKSIDSDALITYYKVSFKEVTE